MLKGKNAIITGARSGIGLATLELFARKGANCWAVVHRDDDAFLQKIEQLQEAHGVLIRPVHIDLSDSDSIRQGLRGIFAEKLPIDILVNAAGIVTPNRLFTMTSMADIRKVMDVNFFSILETIQLVARVMQRQRRGSIVNIASIAAWGIDAAQLEYAASKAALLITTKKLAGELGAYGIRVNAVAPGLTETKMIEEFDDSVMEEMKAGMPLHRFGHPAEIAEVIAFLASDAASYVTGATIRADGGSFDLRVKNTSYPLR